MGNTKSAEISDKQQLSLPKVSIPSESKKAGTISSKKYGKRCSTSSQGSGSQSGRTTKPVLPQAQRQIVKGCMDNAKEDIAERIYRRVIEKRDDFRTFVDSLSTDQKTVLAENLREFLKGVVDRLTDSEEVVRISQEFGERHVQFKTAGFRPDFFVTTADAVTVECVFLDAAVHSGSDTLTAWSTLTSLTFSSVRDGFYNEMRRQRRASNCRKITLEAAPDDEENKAPGSQGSRSISPRRRSTEETGSEEGRHRKGGEEPEQESNTRRRQSSFQSLDTTKTLQTQQEEVSESSTGVSMAERVESLRMEDDYIGGESDSDQEERTGDRNFLLPPPINGY